MKVVLAGAGAFGLKHLDAIKAIGTPVIEVHLSDPMQREDFRHRSYVGMAAAKTVQGLGARSYLVALDAVAEM